MAPTRSHPASSSSSSDASSSAHLAPSSASSRRRKGIPHKAPTRNDTSTSTTTSSAKSVNAPVLLRLLLSTADSHSSLDNKRHRPVSPPVKTTKDVKKKSLVGARDVLPAVQEGYGRGNRTSRRALSTDYLDLGQAFPPSASARGRSPGVAKGKAREVYGGRMPGSVGANGGRRTTSLNYAAGNQIPPYSYGVGADYLSVPPPAGSHPPSTANMTRAASVGSSSAHHTRTSPTMAAAAYAAPVPSPLARSFSANGAVTSEREARSRIPSANGIARVAELGGHAFDYSPPAPYVAA
ncbi:hypothetical protein JCM11251_005726 [Rhodosporidiobolus azoricus]